MDYCHVCRRHLNGALACAGCGTPAEELRQPDIIDLGVYDPASPTAEARQADAPYCYQCGVQMQRAGSCFACPSCGTTSGCS